MQSRKRGILGALVIIVGCAACCALPIFLTGGIAGVLGGFAAKFGKFNGWMVGAAVAALVTVVGGWWFVRNRTRALRA